MSRVELLTPLGALAGLAVAPALVVFLRARRRARAARAALRLPPLPARAGWLEAGCLVALGALVALAAAQPAVRSLTRRPVRQSAAAYVVLDTSRSMLAARAASAPSRLERARHAALEVRAALHGIPVGVASVTDRVLPHLFPTADESAFARTLQLAVRAGEPPPQGGGTTTSSLAALGAFGTENLFLPETRRRAVVVLTDAESLPFPEADLARELRTGPPLTLAIVRLGSLDERVFDADGIPEPGYRPDPRAPARARRVAALAAGRAFDEHAAAAAGRAVRAALGGGTAPRDVVVGRSRTLLTAWLLGAAAVPLALLLLSRNLPPGSPARALATLSRARRRSSVG